MMSDKPYRICKITAMGAACYLVYNPTEAILVDTARKGSGKKIMARLHQVGLEPSALKLIVITHSHYDHAGSAREIKSLTGAPVAVHRKDANELRKGYGPLPGGTRWKARIIVALGRAFLKRLGRIPPFEPDIIVDDQLDLDRFGFKGKIIHMPGHTDGSVVVYLEGGDVISGDTLFGLQNKEIFPPFADDTRSLLESWGKLLDMPVDYFYPGHGRKISKAELAEEYPSAKLKYGK